MAFAAHARLSQVRLDQPRAAGRLGLSPEHRDRAAADAPAYVSADAGGPRGRDAPAQQVMRGSPRTAPLRWLLVALLIALLAAGAARAADEGDDDDDDEAQARAAATQRHLFDRESVELSGASYRLIVNAP